jgi:prephenate dehydrogenase
MSPRHDVRGPVLIVGTGLLGTSLGLALRELGVEVGLENRSPSSLHLARDLGAGEPAGPGFQPRLVVVATPPDVIVSHVVAALRAHPDAVVTDVASVKGGLAEAVALEVGDAVARFVGSHPMAGRERSGAAAADSDLYQGRTWVICPHASADGDAVAAVRRLAISVGSLPVVMDAAAHDSAVAAVSHVPQLVASLTAARLADLPTEALALAGQGVRDVTRIAASDPMMWSAILAANARSVLPHAEALLASLEDVVGALRTAAEEGPGAPGVMKAFAGVIEGGRRGVARIPGKHGGAARRYAEVTVFVPDKPGELGRLFAEIGAAAVNIEDLRLEHAAGAKLGVATLSVLPARIAELTAHLEELGWRVMA